MKKISSLIQRNHIALFFIVVNLVGLFTSRIVMSNGMIWFFALALIPNSILSIFIEREQHSIAFKEQITGFIKYKPFLAQLSIVAVALFGCIYSTDLSNSFKVITTYSPFLFMPIAFGAIKAFTKKQFIFILYAYTSIVFIATIIILINYFLHYDSINIGLKQGQAIPTPYHEHIRFSLMICFSICSLIYLALKNYSISNMKIEKRIQLIMICCLVICIHVLSVRSGILSLYICLMAIASYIIIYYKKYLLGLCIITFIIIAPIVSYSLIPSVQNKINYMLWDLDQMKNNNAKNYSDAERITSIVAGWKIVQKHPLIGVGTGDLKQKMNQVYEQDYKWLANKNRKMPHNQWVWLWASNGILGVLSLLFSILYALFYRKQYKNILLICFFIITISSFLYEHTLQTQVGVAFYVVSLLIMLNYLRGKENVDENRI
ncbi:MAG: O-antigen ligase family protein [Bacteroidota bacterium]